MALNYTPQFRKLSGVPNVFKPGVVLSTTFDYIPNETGGTSLVLDETGLLYFNNLTQNIDGINVENNTLHLKTELSIK